MVTSFKSVHIVTVDLLVPGIVTQNLYYDAGRKENIIDCKKCVLREKYLQKLCTITLFDMDSIERFTAKSVY